MFKFAGNRCSNLVGLIRFQYGLVVLINKACVNHKTYKLPSRYALFTKKNTRHINAFYNWVLKTNLIVDITSTTQPSLKSCYNCGSTKHKKANYIKLYSNATITCRRCGKQSHQVANCTIPYYKQCYIINYLYNNCLVKKCNKYNIINHKANDSINCLKY